MIREHSEVQQTSKAQQHQHDHTTSPVDASNIFIERFFGAFYWKEFACGCGAAFINIGTTYPIYKIIFRQMLHGVRVTSAFEQLRNEGLLYLYRGMLPPLAQKTLSLSIMFGVFDGTRRYIVDDFHINAYKAKVIAGMTAGTVETFLLPLERIQTLLADSKYHKYFANTSAAFSYVLRNHGIKELYRGVIPVIWRNGPSNAMFFILREEASSHLPERTSISTKTAQEFTAGAIIGATTSTVFYPFNVIKVSMQSDMGKPSKSIWKTCLNIYQERGSSIACFYRGCAFNTARSFISWGVMNTAYEHLKELMNTN